MCYNTTDNRDEKLEKARQDMRRVQGERAGLQAAVETQASFWARRVTDVETELRQSQTRVEAALQLQQVRVTRLCVYYCIIVVFFVA
jgi:hypothetical protein